MFILKNMTIYILDIGPRSYRLKSGYSLERDPMEYKCHSDSIKSIIHYCRSYFTNDVKIIKYNIFKHIKAKYSKHTDKETFTMFIPELQGTIFNTGESIHKFIEDNYYLNGNSELNLFVSLSKCNELYGKYDNYEFIYPSINCPYTYTIKGIKEYEKLTNKIQGITFDSCIPLLNFHITILSAMTIIVFNMLEHKLNHEEDDTKTSIVLDNGFKFCNESIKDMYLKLFQGRMSNYSKTNSIETVIASTLRSIYKRTSKPRYGKII
jgi:hypothetical protein